MKESWPDNCEDCKKYLYPIDCHFCSRNNPKPSRAFPAKCEEFTIYKKTIYNNGKVNYQNFTTVHQFTDWDRLDLEISRVAKRVIWGNLIAFDILGWRFLDSEYWHDELYVIPVGAKIAVKWLVGCRVEAVEAVEASCTQPQLASTASTGSTASTSQPGGAA